MIRLARLSIFLGTLAVANDTALLTHSEFSYINTQGNTNTSSLAFEGSAKQGWEMHLIRAHADAYRSEDEGKESKNKYSVELNYDYQFAPHFSLNYLLGYKEDRFSGFDYQFYTGPGMGLKVLDSNVQKLDFQGNLLYAKDKPDFLPSDEYLSTKLGGIYEWKIQEHLKFIQEATYRVNLEETKYYFLYSKTALETKINSNFSMGVSYKVDYVNTPPPPSLHSDRTFLVSLIIDY